MNEQSQFLLYTAPDGAVKVDVFFKGETAWLTQKALAELFGVQVPAINKHLKNIFDTGELVEAAVISILETTAADGKNYLSTFGLGQMQRIVSAYLDMAESEFEKYRIVQDRMFESDFDREIKRLEGNK